MLHFEHQSVIPAAVKVVFGFHEQPDALERLTPPWQRVKVVRRTGGLEVGAIVELRVYLAGPLYLTWVAHHIGYAPERYFIDEQRRGPFAAWVHRHQFTPVEQGTELTDSIEFAMRGGLAVETLAGPLVHRQLRRMFVYRHEVTRRACVSATSAAR